MKLMNSLILVVFCAVLAASLEDVPCYKSLGSKNVDGSVGNPMVTSLTECAHVCNTATQCTGFLYVPDMNKASYVTNCWIKSHSSSVYLTNAHAESNVQLYLQTSDDCKDAEYESGEPAVIAEIPCYTLHEDKDFYGSDLKSANAESEEECAGLCDTDATCVGFTFIDRRQQVAHSNCYLKSDIKPEMMQTKPGSYVFVKDGVCENHIPEVPNFYGSTSARIEAHHHSHCSHGWRQIGNSCYYLSGFTRTWYAAQQMCKKTYQSDLAVFESRTELDRVKVVFNPTREGNYWVGAKRHDNGVVYWEYCTTPGAAYTCKYTRVPSSLWAPLQPSFYKMQEYWAEIRSGYNGLNDFHNHAQRFLCEYHLKK